MGVFHRLYHGETKIDFIGRTKRWFAISLAIIAIGLISLLVRGLNLGIDFEGGVVWEAPAGEASVSDVRDALDGIGLGDAEIQTASSDEGDKIRVQYEALDADKVNEVQERLADVTGADTDEVSVNSVGPSWGEEISRKALRALIVFLVVITIYISLRFEFKMAIPTLAALIHDILVTVGVYSVVGFEVTPATVIAFLTILGYSIYDGIVVFDKVDENTRLVSAASRMTYSDMVNLSLNQTLMRSLNTTLTAVLPITSLLVVGSWILGARTLEEFAVALLVGLASGAYSSIFIASPLLAVLKEREPRYRDIKRRIETRTGRSEAVAVDVVADDGEAAEKVAVGAGRGRTAPPPPRFSANRPPRPRKKGKRR